MKRAGLSMNIAPLATEGATSLVEGVYQAVLGAILDGRLAPNSVISEVALAKQLDVSRTPVHDALRQLAKDGVLERSMGRRARVATFTRDDIYDIFELRKFLEGPAAELAATRMEERELQSLLTSARELSVDWHAPDWKPRWTDFDERFHLVIAEASGNRRLAQDISRYRMLHRGFNRIRADAESLQKALAEHFEILAAIEQRDGPGARAAMIAHISTWQAYFIEHLRS